MWEQSSGTGASQSAGSESTGATVNANEATLEELTAALEQAGVAKAEKIADEVMEYRPYTASDLESKLGDELGKYGVDAAELAKIVSVLEV